MEIDPLVEGFYQRLMICYHRLGRNADAVLIFRRCLKNFDRLLKVTPSTQTKALYNNLVARKFSVPKKNEMKPKKSNL
jgi:DNA-binding SARP family transcriptional activator